jgi:hypothetical protein
MIFITNLFFTDTILEFKFHEIVFTSIELQLPDLFSKEKKKFLLPLSSFFLRNTYIFIIIFIVIYFHPFSLLHVIVLGAETWKRNV